METRGCFTRMLVTLALWACSVVLIAFPASARTSGEYFGDYYLYERVETYSSSDGGKVSLLRPSGFDYYDSTWLPTAVLVEGQFGVETVGVVARLVQRQPDIRTLFLDSPGGLLIAGMQLGLIASKLELTMVVNAQAECHSACALAFLGGKHRKILTTDVDKFSFHRQYYLVEGRAVYGTWKRDTALIDGYLKSLSMTAISAEEIVGTTGRVSLSQDRLRERGITTISNAEHYQHVLLTSPPRTLYERFLVACYRLSPSACEANPPLLREPALRQWAVMCEAVGQCPNNARAKAGLSAVVDMFRGATWQEIQVMDCKAGDGFLDNLDIRLAEASMSPTVNDKTRFERRHAELREWCSSLMEKR